MEYQNYEDMQSIDQLKGRLEMINDLLAQYQDDIKKYDLEYKCKLDDMRCATSKLRRTRSYIMNKLYGENGLVGSKLAKKTAKKPAVQNDGVYGEEDQDDGNWQQDPSSKQ